MITQEIEIGFEQLKDKSIGELQEVEASKILKTRFQTIRREAQGEDPPTAEELIEELVDE